MHCLLSQSDIFLHFICPSLDAETLEWANSITTGQKKENTAHQPREGCHIDQEPPCEQTHSEELAEEHTKGDRDNPEVHAEHVKDPSEGDSVSTLPLAVALNTLSELLGKESTMNLTAVSFSFICSDIHSQQLFFFFL